MKEVFDRLVDVICDRMAESIDAANDPNAKQGTRLSDQGGTGAGCGC